MTPKEKAEELVRKYNKKIASIVAKEMTNETSLGLLMIEWWKEVGKEIEKL